MSYKSGTDYVEWAMELQQRDLSHEREVELWTMFIKKLENDDCDTLYNLLGSHHCYDEAYFSIHPKEENE